MMEDVDDDDDDDVGLVVMMKLLNAVTDDAFQSCDDDAFPMANQDDDYEFAVDRDYDCCQNLRCLHLTAVFVSFFYSSFCDFGT